MPPTVSAGACMARQLTRDEWYEKAMKLPDDQAVRLYEQVSRRAEQPTPLEKVIDLADELFSQATPCTATCRYQGVERALTERQLPKRMGSSFILLGI